MPPSPSWNTLPNPSPDACQESVVDLAARDSHGIHPTNPTIQPTSNQAISQATSQATKQPRIRFIAGAAGVTLSSMIIPAHRVTTPPTQRRDVRLRFLSETVGDEVLRCCCRLLECEAVLTNVYHC